MSFPSESARPATSKAAVASLICGIGGFLTGPITGIPAIIAGHIGMANIKRSGGALKGSNMALAGLITGYMTTVLISMVALAAPLVLRQANRVSRGFMDSQLREFGHAFSDFEADQGGFYPGTATFEKMKGDPAIDPANPLTQLKLPDLNALLAAPANAKGPWYYFPAASHTHVDVILISPGLDKIHMALKTDGIVYEYSEDQVGAYINKTTAANKPPVEIAATLKRKKR